MIPSAFDYHRPATLAEATQLLASSEDAKLLAGGHSLLPMMKLRLANPRTVIDIGRLEELRGIQEAGDAIIIGANVTHYEAETSDVLRRRCPILAETAAAIGDVQVRNVGTVGGSVAHADPAADWPAAMLAVNAEFTLSKSGGARTVGATEFFLDLLTTAMEEDEILTNIRVRANPPRTGGAYLKVPQPASGFALAGVAAQVTLGGGDTIAQVAVGITGVDNQAFRASATEAALQGQAATEAAISQAAAQATDGAEASEDIHASAEYRLHLARVYTKRALLQAVQRAQNAS